MRHHAMTSYFDGRGPIGGPVRRRRKRATAVVVKYAECDEVDLRSHAGISAIVTADDAGDARTGERTGAFVEGIRVPSAKSERSTTRWTRRS